MSTYVIGEGRLNSSSPQQPVPRSMTDFSQPVTIQQYQAHLHQQPPPPPLHDGFHDEEDAGGYRYPGSGVGVLPTTGLHMSDSLVSHIPPQRSISMPVNTENFKSDFLMPSVPLQAQHSVFAGSASNTSTRQTNPPVFNEDAMQTSTMQLPEPTSASQTHSSTGQAPYQRVARFVGPPPVPVACTECRGRHLKCDAGTPSCGRCVADGRECTYVKSRRGWKGSRRRQHGSTNRTGSVSGSEAGFGVMSDGGNGGSTSRTPSLSRQSSTSRRSPASSPPLSRHPAPSLSQAPSALETVRNHYRGSTSFPSVHDHNPPPPTANLIQLYYAYFHASHPFILPPAYLIKTPAAKLTQLLPVMRFIGSFFASSAPHQSFRDAADFTLFQQNAPRNTFTVQALLLFAIGLHADNEQERSGQVKDAAIEMALEMGMNIDGFAEAAGEGDSVMEESCRRTWWELYFLDGIFAGVHQRDCFRLWSIECTAALPCEEDEYLQARIPSPKTLIDFDDRFFADGPWTFSSYAYRIEAVRILGQVLACAGSGNPNDPSADAADERLVSWMLHLPAAKKDLVDKNFKVDEMLFQAHMIINAASIYLHRPKSHLALSLVPDETSCTPPTQWSTTAKPVAFHTTKAIRAADAISKLITLPTPLIKHSPFFTCMITLGAIVHLSACSWLLYGDEGYLAKERIRLSVGALKTLEDVWHVAGCVLLQVKLVAREVFALPRPEGARGGGILTEDEIFKLIDEEQSIDLLGIDSNYQGLPHLNWDGN